MSWPPRMPHPPRLLAGSRRRQLLLALAVLCSAALLAFGVRLGADRVESASQAAQAAAKASRVPSSAQIEEQWGIRVTRVQLLADNGLVELRYQVLDSTKSGRLHADPSSLSNIPWMKVEGNGGSIKSQSVMFHFQHGVGQGVEGNTYSIIYGNASNAVHKGARITVVMPDGLQLQHVPVYG